MALGRRNGMIGDDEEEVALFEEVAISEEEVYLGNISDSDTPPHLCEILAASESGDLGALRLALDNLSGSVDQQLEDGDTALHLTCLYGHLPCVQLLLDRGASLEAKDEDGAIPIHDACAGGFTQIVQLLLDKANDPQCVTRMLNTGDLEGDTPLHHAARGEYVDVIRLLLSYGASPTRRNIYAKIPSELADPGSEARSILESAARSAAEQHCG